MMKQPSTLWGLAMAAAAGLAPHASAQLAPTFDIVVIAEVKVGNEPEIHAPMVAAARLWLDKLAADSGFTVTYVESPNGFTDEYLSRFELILQLNYTPFRWNATAQAAFEKYIDQGKGGWIGIHHAFLYGPAVWPASEKLWTWYGTFLGGINYKNYIASFAEGTVHLEDSIHPVLKGVPKTFLVTTDEWYTFDRSPRPNVRVLAKVDESSYKPPSTLKMGDHPVIWTNEKYKARNLFLFIGHHPNLYQNEAYKTLLRNAILWAATKPGSTGIRKSGRGAAGPGTLVLDVRADKQAIHYANPGMTVRSLALVDASGHVLYQARGKSLTGRIDRSAWSAGSYLLRATTSRGPISQWLKLD